MAGLISLTLVSFIPYTIHITLNSHTLVKVYIDPTVVLVSTKTDDAVIDRLDPDGRSGSSNSGDSKFEEPILFHTLTSIDDQFRLPFLLEVRPPNEFSYDSAISKLVSLRLGEDHESKVQFVVPGDIMVGNSAHDGESTSGQQGRLLHLAGMVDLGSHLTV